MYLQYLNKIEQGLPIDWDRFWKAIPVGHKKVEDFKISKFGVGKKYLVSFKNDEIKQKYLPAENVSERVAAASLGDSHKGKVSVASLPTYDLRTGVYSLLVCSNTSVIQQGKEHSRAVIIENKEIFFAGDKLNRILEINGIGSLDVDVILGNGNEISNGYFTRFLESYEQILCILDHDYGGLLTYNTIKKHLKTDVFFCLPSNVKVWLDCFKKTPTSENFSRAIKLCQLHNLQELENAFRLTSRFMEQELLLGYEW